MVTHLKNLCLLLILLLPLSVTADSLQVRTSEPYSNLFVLKQKIEKSIGTHDPSEIAAALDLDDTLILIGDPFHDGKFVAGTPHAEGAKFILRPGAQELVDFLTEKGIKLVISSAHPKFEETVAKLHDVNLLTSLGMSSTKPLLPQTSKFSVILGNHSQEVQGANVGNIASAKYSTDEEFIRKAASIHLALSEQERSKIRTIYFVDDRGRNHDRFIKELTEYAPSNLPNLKEVETFRLTRTKESHFKNSFEQAIKTGGSPVQVLYTESYSRVAPVVIGAVDQYLKKGLEGDKNKNHRQFYFLARDGIGGYEIAKILIQKFPKRYASLNPDQLHYVYINSATISNRELTKKYLQEQGLKSGHSAYFFDIGWLGSIEDRVHRLVDEVGGTYGGTHYIFHMGAPRNNIRAYLPITGQDPPFDFLSGNKAIHFMEDTFSGDEMRATVLAKGSTGKIKPVIPTGPAGTYPADELAKRHFALRALTDAAEDLDGQEELDALAPDNASSLARDALYPFLNRLKAHPELQRQVMVPHIRS